MFTGLIEAIGHISAREMRGSDLRLQIATGKLPLHDLRTGDSIAVNGVCLTAVQVQATGFWADVSAETLARSTLEAYQPGERVNLEKALTPSTRLGGHLVSGHVDGVGEVCACLADGRSQRLSIVVPPALARYIAEKGSICVDGVSLTVNEVAGVRFGVNIVPHTLTATTLGDYAPGRRVNLEVDILARYLERLLQAGEGDKSPTGLTRELLRRQGFIQEDT